MPSFWQRTFLKLVSFDPRLVRWIQYRDPRKYWQERGGEQYFNEQEAVYNRTRRSQFIGGEVNQLSYRSLLEIGCGYGKQLENFIPKNAFLVGCDFSRPQLLKAQEYLLSKTPALIEADGSQLPFQDKTFDVVFSSAVILHNDYEKAKRMMAEMIRVSRKYLVHNEDTDVTFSRFGYDMKKTYEKMKLKILKSQEIPVASDPEITQFTIVELPSENFKLLPSEVPLQYH